MNIIKTNNFETLSMEACDLVVNTIKNVKQPAIGLATGSTPEGLYKCLIERYINGEISFSDVTTFNLDEYVGLAETHPGSYQYYMRENFFNHIDIASGNAHIPSGIEADLNLHCTEYEEKIESKGRIDLQILGVGINGHIGFNEPGTSFESKTHIVELKPSTREVNSRFFESVEEVPTQALTMGIQTIMNAKEIILLISGANKAETVKAFIESEVSEDFPASILKTHPNFTLIVDEEAYALV